MRSRSICILALGFSTLLASTACTRDLSRFDPPPSPAPSVAPSPTGPSARDELMAALQRTQAAPFRYAVKSDLPDSESLVASGAFDSVKRILESSTTVNGGVLPGTYRQIVIGENAYVRANKDQHWVHVDLSRVKKANTLRLFDTKDPLGLARFISVIGTVERKDAHTYTGWFRRDSSGGEFLPIGAPSLVMFGGLAVPFTLTVDGRGFVTSIHIELPQSGKPTLVMDTTLQDHGKPLLIKAPAKSNVREADDIYYR